MFDLPGDDAHACIYELLNFRRYGLKQCEHAAYVEAANDYSDSFLSKVESDIDRSAELICLHPHQTHHHSVARSTVQAGDTAKRESVHRLVHQMYSQFNLTKKASVTNIFSETV